MRTRLTLALIGVTLAPYGTYQLLTLGPDNLLATAIWLAGGARPDNPTLLDRNYPLGWLLLTTTVAATTTATVLLHSRPSTPRKTQD